MKRTILTLSALFIGIIGFTQTFTSDFITYSVIEPDEVSVFDYDMAGGPSVTIPATVDYDGTTYNVTYIGYQAFMSNELTSVTIPNSVTTIVNAAFIFNSLSTVTIPNSVTHIYAAAFGSNELTSVTLGENVIFIAENAFNGNLLTSIDLPVGVTTIEKQTFANNNFTDVIIPNGITEIGEGAFSGNPLSSVTSISSTPPVITTGPGITDSFAEDRSDIDLYIPMGTMGPYVTDPGALWTGFKTATETGFAGIEDTDTEAELSVYPNPATDVLNIDFEGPVEHVKIVNISGEIMETIINPTQPIDVSHLTKGVYFLQIETTDGFVNKKFIKA